MIFRLHNEEYFEGFDSLTQYVRLSIPLFFASLLIDVNILIISNMQKIVKFREAEQLVPSFIITLNSQYNPVGKD